MKNIKKILLASSLLLPMVSFAAPLDGIKGLLNGVLNLMDLVVPIIIGLGMIFFLWGLAQFILKANEEKAREEGKKRMIWGIVALFVMISIWGIITFVGNAIDIKPSNSPILNPFNIPSR